MKKQIALFLAAMLTVGAAGCGTNEAEQQQVTTEAGTAATEDAEVGQAEAEQQPEVTDGEAAQKAEEKEGNAETENGNAEAGEVGEAGDSSATEEAPSEPFALKQAYLLADGAPEVAAGAAVLIEESTGTILYEKNAEQKMYPASMTKVLTALVAMEYFAGDELITVGTEINEVSLDSSKAGHILGETITVENVIRGLIIPSGNDSANVIAAAVAKRAENKEDLSFGQCEVIFTDLMNKKAQALGATGSHFANAHGYHDENHYTTAKDMALFAKAFMENPVLEGIANEKSFSGNGANGQFAEDPSVVTQDYAWKSHNLLITDGEYNYPYASGIKTGFTNEAGDCVAAAAKKDGENMIAVVFQSEDPNRWLDSKNLFEYGFQAYDEVVLAKADTAIEEMPLTKHKQKEGDTLAIVTQKEYVTYLPTTANAPQVSVTYLDTYAEQDKEGNTVLRAPIAKGTEVGTATYTIDGKKILETPVYAGRDVSKGSVFSRIAYFFQNLFSNIFSPKGLLTIGGVVAAVAVVGFAALKIRGGRRHRSRGGYSLGSRSAGLSFGGKKRGKRFRNNRRKF